ncbi:MAG TPA: DNA alkylation response protein [Hyphomonas sp.]|uniref:acyl-CoA dehydrogenase family protein n=1 Tax=uncultured Hyphomonas sp. TaxID=225298 RepID=UPI000C4814EA|nr:DNA alkylation response protein [Hyphomonas sp.]MAN91644.1 DNA alkylation response protein [Hyphomonadaceae bacterium]HBL93772.1 DNA alkylation response protein [Hyphomonas sp.]HCJ18808.1 DNA alkylation response protein [Hyphomonas sp.]|tara:strand:- start:61279 stop:62928 length:1650 start_codon:yes stop_codon:yes gene_type:complete
MHKPRTSLQTHDVTNQPRPPGDLDLLSDPALFDPLMASFARRDAGSRDTQTAGQHIPHLTAFAKQVGARETRELGRQADENPPRLKAFNAQGERIDEVEFHPAYHALMKIGLEAGVSSRAWSHPGGGQIAHAALLYMMSWADSGVTCPMSMTYAAQPVLRQSDWASVWAEKARTPAYDPKAIPLAQKSAATIGMAMTEKQGGSDLRTNTTRASALSPQEVELTGHKWFCSAPMCDAFLTLAYEDQGLSCFLAPRWHPDGSRNQIEIQRLKDKMGDRSNASSEIEYRGAYARRIGAPGRGIATIIQMAHHTRYDCMIGSASGMRQAVCRAAFHVSQRTAFQKTLIDHPLMRAVIADLALESEAAIALTMRVGAGFDLSSENEREAALSRALTPLAKFWICKHQPAVVSEALECFGGIGFVEETGMARLFRTSPLNAIWEGSGNIMALDLQRALSDKTVRAVFNEDLTRIAAEIPETATLVEGLRSERPENLRLFAQQAALVFSADALAGSALRDMYVQTRILNPTPIWGAFAGRVDLTPAIARTTNWMMG